MTWYTSLLNVGKMISVGMQFCVLFVQSNKKSNNYCKCCKCILSNASKFQSIDANNQHEKKLHCTVYIYVQIEYSYYMICFLNCIHEQRLITAITAQVFLINPLHVNKIQIRGMFHIHCGLLVGLQIWVLGPIKELLLSA